jgi:hypothetical protein
LLLFSEFIETYGAFISFTGLVKEYVGIWNRLYLR